MKLDVWHNDMWPRYKALVFSHLARMAKDAGVDLSITHIAETTSDRVALSPVDYSVHDYDYDNLFKLAYSDIPGQALCRRVAALARSSQADLTILSGYHRPEHWTQALILLARGRRYAVFCDSTINDNPQLFWRGLAKRIFFAFCSGGFCYGQRASEYLRHYGMPERKIVLDCQAAWLPPDYDAAQIPERRRRLRKQAEAIRFLYVGRLSKEKHVDVLLRAFRSTLESRPDARLVIVGAGPERAALEALTAELGVAPRVEFAGARSGQALMTEYLKASCLVLPSWSEPWGLVANEALSHGCPIIVSDRCGCVPELVNDGRSGFLFEAGDVDGLAAAMRKAPETFLDNRAAVQACLAQIAPYTAANAAASILHGACALAGMPLARSEPSGAERHAPAIRVRAVQTAGAGGR